MFAPDPGAAEQSQIGGNVATNAGGPHALKYGVTGNWVSGLEVVVAPGELIELGGWIGKDVAGYDLKRLLIGSEGTLGVITAVRLRLLPAPEAALAAGRVPAHASRGLCGDRRGVRRGPRAVGARLPRRRDARDRGRRLSAREPGIKGRCTGGPRAGRLRADRRGRRHARAGRSPARGGCSSCSVRRRWPFTSRPTPARCGAGATASTAVVTAVRGAKVSEDVVFPVERLAEGLERVRADRRTPRPALVRVGARGRRERACDRARRPRRGGGARRGRGGRARSCSRWRSRSGDRSTGEHGVGWLKRGQLESQWDTRAVRAARAGQACVRSQGPDEPGQEAGTVPCRLACHI